MHTQKMVEEEEKWESLELRGKEVKEGKEDGFLSLVSVERGDCVLAATVRHSEGRDEAKLQGGMGTSMSEGELRGKRLSRGGRGFQELSQCWKSRSCCWSGTHQ